MKTCIRCGLNLPLDSFSKGKKHRDGRRNECRACAAEYHREYVKAHPEAKGSWERRNPEAVKAAQHRKTVAKYGLTPEAYGTMLLSQGGVCAICSGPQTAKGRGGAAKPLEIDHDHATGEVRGLLCSGCNVGIAHLRHNPELLSRAISYLTR